MKKILRNYFSNLSFYADDEYIYWGRDVNGFGVFMGTIGLPFVLICLPFILVSEWLNNED